MFRPELSTSTVSASAVLLTNWSRTCARTRCRRSGWAARNTIIDLARRFNKYEALDFDQAVKELERAVEVALDIIDGERRTHDDAFVNTVLARVAERVRSDDLVIGGAQAIHAALAVIEAGHRRSQKALLEEGIKIHTLRRDAGCSRPAYRTARLRVDYSLIGPFGCRNSRNGSMILCRTARRRASTSRCRSRSNWRAVCCPPLARS